MTRMKVSWGAFGVVEPAQARLFGSSAWNDATTQFANRVVELDRDPKVSAAWVRLEMIGPNGVHEPKAYWTKTSDETPTTEGEVCPV